MTEAPHVTVAADKSLDDVACAGCGEPFDNSEWPVESSASDAYGGSGTHSCPTDGCEGTVTVLF